MLSNNKFHSSRGTVKEKGCSGNHSYLAQRSLKIAWNQSSNYRNQFLQLHITRLTPQLSLLSSAVRSLIRNVNRLDDLFSREKKSVGQVKNFTHTHTHTHTLTHPSTHPPIHTHPIFNLRYFHFLLFSAALGATPVRSNIKAQLK